MSGNLLLKFHLNLRIAKPEYSQTDVSCPRRVRNCKVQGARCKVKICKVKNMQGARCKVQGRKIARCRVFGTVSSSTATLNIHTLL